MQFKMKRLMLLGLLSPVLSLEGNVRGRRRAFGIDDYNLFVADSSAESLPTYKMTSTVNSVDDGSNLAPTGEVTIESTANETLIASSSGSAAFYAKESKTKNVNRTGSAKTRRDDMDYNLSGSQSKGLPKSLYPKGASKNSKSLKVPPPKVWSSKGSVAKKKHLIAKKSKKASKVRKSKKSKKSSFPTLSPSPTLSAAPSLRPFADMPAAKVPPTNKSLTIAPSSANIIQPSKQPSITVAPSSDNTTPSVVASPTSTTDVSLSPYTILYSLDLTRIPQDTEVDQVVSLTAEYLIQRFNETYPDVLAFETSLEAKRLTSPVEPFVMNYTSTATFRGEGFPTRETLDVSLSRAFTQEGKADYIILLQQQLDQSNIFATTSDISFILDASTDDDTSGNRTASVADANEIGRETVVAGAASATVAAAMIVFGAAVYLSRTQSESGEDTKQAFSGENSSMCHETVAETYAGTTVCTENDSFSINGLPEALNVLAEADDATQWTMQAMSVIADGDCKSVSPGEVVTDGDCESITPSEVEEVDFSVHCECESADEDDQTLSSSLPCDQQLETQCQFSAESNVCAMSTQLENAAYNSRILESSNQRQAISDKIGTRNDEDPRRVADLIKMFSRQ
ncbi:hypothetical protein MPSEU_000734000 [Mayamaea pseudoterrestris]|nr:hypothetical protein MPSEU_000734000 [Mayamaea pseudoterrestris]